MQRIVTEDEEGTNQLRRAKQQQTLTSEPNNRNTEKSVVHMSLKRMVGVEKIIERMR